MAKTIFITGGAAGIGRACVEKFLTEGWNVGFIDVDSEAAEALLSDLDNDGSVMFVPGDTRSRSAVHRAVDAVVQSFGELHSLFVNAGIHRSNTILDITDEELRQMIDVNIYGSVNTLREAVPYIIKSGGGSVVINASDQWFIGKAHSFAYGLTKGALGQITRSLAIDLAPYNIRVNAVCPGTIRTPLVDRIFERCAAAGKTTVKECWEEENALFLRGEAGRPEEVAELVFFLAGDKAAFCTGGHYPIDGGLVCQ